MRKYMVLVFVSVLGITAISSQNIQVSKAEISFIFEHKSVAGTIGDLQSTSTIDFENFEQSVLAGSVGISTLDTDNSLRDGHLMWRKYFHRKAHPRLLFKSTKIIKANDKTYEVVGELTIKGTTNEVTFTASFLEDQLQLNGEINIAEYGVVIEKKKERNIVTIAMSFPLE